jgi:myxalamid-type polyketide synthase MxaB
MLGQTSGRIPPLLGDMPEAEDVDQQPSGETGVDQAFRNALLAADSGARVAMLRDHFVDELSRIMSLPPEELDVDQPLSEIGMDSLLVMELKNNLETRLAFNIPMSVFLEGPSIGSLANHAARLLVGNDAPTSDDSSFAMDDTPAARDADQPTSDSSRRSPAPTPASPTAEAKPFDPIVCLQSAGDGPPLFCVHPLGGDVSCYADLARHIQDRQVYGIRGRGRRGRYTPPDTLDEMIAEYLDAIRRVQPDGPYHLASWSAGGMFSYALARALRDRRAEIGLLMLLDTPLPSIYENVNLDDDVAFLVELSKFANWFAGAEIDVDSLPLDQLRAMEERKRWEFMLRLAKLHGAVPPETTVDRIQVIIATAHRHATMIRDYQVAPLDQPIHLVRPEQPDVLGRMTGQTLAADLGWKRVLGDRLRLHQSPGDHFSMIQGENAPSLAALIVDQIPSPTSSRASN